jgi:hypothetical protein
MPQYKDLGSQSEDDRIQEIGEHTMIGHKVCSFMTDNEPGKADRYITKLQERFPGIRIVERGDGPIDGVVWVKVGPPLE